MRIIQHHMQFHFLVFLLAQTYAKLSRLCQSKHLVFIHEIDSDMLNMDLCPSH